MTFTLEDYICRLHTGSWYTWSDSSSKGYANLRLATGMMNAAGDVISNPHTLPSEADCTTGVATLQSDWDGKVYARSRKEAYDLLNQFELIGDDATNGTTTHKDAIAAIKAAHPKP